MDIVIPQSIEAFGGKFYALQTCCDSILAAGHTPNVLWHTPTPEIQEFRKHYRHNSTNSFAFERFCFEQWFTIRDWMRENRRKVVFKIDSDVLMFDGLNELWERIPNNGLLYTMPSSVSFVTIEGIEEICDFIMDAFTTGQELALSLLSGDHVSDYVLLQAAAKGFTAKGRHFPDLCYGFRPLMVDANLYLEFGVEKMYEGHRDILFVNGNPFFCHGMHTVQMVTLHCWGKSKRVIPAIWAQSCESKRKGFPVRLHVGL